jgi:predicted SAM-dependent methyltransferase
LEHMYPSSKDTCEHHLEHMYSSSEGTCEHNLEHMYLSSESTVHVDTVCYIFLIKRYSYI